MYITYEEPLKCKTFTEKQMHEVYRNMVDKTEYPAFEVLNELPNGLHQVVGGFDFPVQVADIRLDTSLFHLPDGSFIRSPFSSRS